MQKDNLGQSLQNGSEPSAKAEYTHQQLEVMALSGMDEYLLGKDLSEEEIDNWLVKLAKVREDFNVFFNELMNLKVKYGSTDAGRLFAIAITDLQKSRLSVEEGLRRGAIIDHIHAEAKKIYEDVHGKQEDGALTSGPVSEPVKEG